MLIVDEKSKYSWIFLTKSKNPPVDLVRLFMKQFGNEDGGVIRVDQGGELARSDVFRTTMLKEFQYVVEPTGADRRMVRWNDITIHWLPLSGHFFMGLISQPNTGLSQLCMRCS